MNQDPYSLKEDQEMRKVFSSVGVAWLLTLVFSLYADNESKPSAAVKTGPAESNTVKIDNFSFTPPTMTIPAGTQVTWVNHDDVPHNIVSTEKRFTSPVLDTDERFSYSFTAPGTYDYYCSLHPRMTAKIIVK
jgi:amicyanin